MLHIIDKVLEPIVTSTRDPQLSNPDAARFLERAGSFNLGSFQIRLLSYFAYQFFKKKTRLIFFECYSDYVQQVMSHKKLSVFATPGRHTFLIPVNRGFEVRIYSS